MLFSVSKYKYIGPEERRDLFADDSIGTKVKSFEDVLKWIKETDQHLDHNTEVVATYVILKNRFMYIADRHSEHVACAQGQDVLSAGEITFFIDKGKVEVIEVTNLSTGYCPAPASWKAVDKALKKAKLLHPKKFTCHFEFRLCLKCETINVIKDDWYVCAMCEQELDKKRNIN